MKYYTGNQTGNAANVGLLPPPYYWWEAGALWGAMIDYWYYTNDSSYNEVVTQALLSQTSPTQDFMPVAQQYDEVLPFSPPPTFFYNNLSRVMTTKPSGGLLPCQP